MRDIWKVVIQFLRPIVLVLLRSRSGSCSSQPSTDPMLGPQTRRRAKFVLFIHALNSNTSLRILHLLKSTHHRQSHRSKGRTTDDYCTKLNRMRNLISALSQEPPLRYNYVFAVMLASSLIHWSSASQSIFRNS